MKISRGRKREKRKKEDKGLIKSFIAFSELKDNYEVWTPCKCRGMIVFIDLLVENGSRISLFEFSDRVKNIERSAKMVKLKTEILSQEKSPKSRPIRSYLVLKEGKKNRKTVLQQEPLLEGQPFEVLFLGDGKVE
ncbi:hypothetical protein AKJ61_01835 [candidate division MSBL1 archaeon SCGC-AAA259B11]|nr:hypothetical protein AKJ61_01835 [candidate division MSBL1 archaeon SCGC-AAA259B11]